ncbi:hypothetical protein FGF66_09020 [Chlorobaculum thiosulfatiphilum]|jgi:hypothetical protein|uniref:PilZ domain-containing protein n=1 Tax=Chlorobaculum thiosulfatiphilum TaxID=115852 RepID=A0A5C4S4N9_CHLTI|nr:hypothetical protein [Chlorobaculum thiosulfatiphilum]NTV82498.1 hypothetical protein [Chlorobaculum sp.]TNJ38394.1 hypothetical protein FGF66_09020 [Chlorobaculum thiosulfatiphilum]
MKFQALRYGEFFQGNISLYNYQRPLMVRFIECIERERQEWLVGFYPASGLNSGMVLAIDHDGQRVLCEIVGRRKGAGRCVRLLDSGIDLEALWRQREPALAEA